MTLDKIDRILQLFTAFAAVASAFAAVAALAITVRLQHEANNNNNHERLLEHRRTALMLALQAIDHEYSNERWDNGDPPDPHSWNIQLARDADNQIRIYCSDPQTHVLFLQALNVYDPTTEKPKVISTTPLDEFRKQIARELELPEPSTAEPNRAWISHLSGAK
jgi:hypothetical protein